MADRGTYAFNINGHPEIGEKADRLIEKLLDTGAKNKADAFDVILKLAAERLDSSEIKAAGGDIDGLEASLENIRSMYAAIVKSKAEIIAARDSTVAEARQKSEARAKAAESEKKRFEEMAIAASSESANAVLQMEQAQAAADAAKKQAESMQVLVAAMDDKIADLQEQLESANAKLKRYDALKEERDMFAKQLVDAKNEAEKAELRVKLESQKAQEELRSRIASLEAEVRILREFQGISDPQ